MGEREGTANSESDLRLVLLAATAFLSWRDTGDFPVLMSEAIDGDALAEAIDHLTENGS